MSVYQIIRAPIPCEPSIDTGGKKILQLWSQSAGCGGGGSDAGSGSGMMIKNVSVIVILVIIVVLNCECCPVPALIVRHYRFLHGQVQINLFPGLIKQFNSIVQAEQHNLRDRGTGGRR